MTGLSSEMADREDPIFTVLAALNPHREWGGIEGRRAEANQLVDWIENNPDCEDRYLPVTGCGGSGKTLVITHVLDYLQLRHGSWKIVVVDTFLAQTLPLFSRAVYEGITGKLRNREYAGALDTLLSADGPGPERVILVVDHIELLAKHAHGKKVLMKLGIWKTGGKVNIIGVSQVDVQVPKELEIMPSETRSLRFKPYSSEDMVQIVTTRLGKHTIFEPAALAHAIRQVQWSVSSDVRELLMVCSKAVHFVASKLRRGEAGPELGTSDGASSIGTVTVEHMRDMLREEHMAACMERIKRLPPVEVRVLQLVAHQDHRRRAWSVLELCASVPMSEQFREVGPNTVQQAVIRLLQGGILHSINTLPGTYQQVTLNAFAQDVELALKLVKDD